MKAQTLLVSYLLVSFLLPSAGRAAEAPQHFYNAAENLDSDPAFIPPFVPLEDTSEARMVYYAARDGLVQQYDVTKVEHLAALGVGEVQFTNMKNETLPVAGFFRHYTAFAVVENNVPVRMEMLIDINSLDTGVPGRNHRILNVFFESMKPALGSARIVFDRFEGDAALKDEEGAVSFFTAVGNLTLNEVTRPVTAELQVTRLGDVWVAETVEPVRLLISDFGFGERVLALMISCNHQSISNEVTIQTKLYFS